MLKIVRIFVQRTYEICVLYHVEHDTFRGGTQDGFVYRKELRSARDCECLAFDYRQVKARKIPLVQCRIVSLEIGWFCPDVPDQ